MNVDKVWIEVLLLKNRITTYDDNQEKQILGQHIKMTTLTVFQNKNYQISI